MLRAGKMSIISAALSKAIAQAVTLKPEESGVAAIEFAMFAGLLSLAVLNATDIAVYIYQRMEVENATEMGAQAAWKNCDFSRLPATTSCPALNAAVQKAVQSTSLGNNVTLQAGSPEEGYYCVNSSNALQFVSDVSSKPADCTAAGTPNLQPGDYIKISTTYSYAPIFPGVTVASAFTTPIRRTAMMRLE
jgi:Flp pilus assembly protein TadG